MIRRSFFALVIVVFSLSPVRARQLEVAYGWGIHRHMMHRMMVRIDHVQLEISAKLKGDPMGQRGYLGLVWTPLPGWEAVPGLAIWHKNGTGKIDAASPWIRLHVVGDNMRLGVDLALEAVHVSVQAQIPLSSVVATWGEGAMTLAYEHSPFYSGPLVGLRLIW